MPSLTYFAFQGIVDERMERLIRCLKGHGWRVDVILIHPRKGWFSQEGGGQHILIGNGPVGNPIVNELFLNPFLLFLRFLFEFPKLRRRVQLLYVHNFPDSFALPILFLARIFRIPSAYEIRDPWKEFISAETSESVRSRTRFKFYLMIVSLIEVTAAALASGFVFATAGLQSLHWRSASGKPTCLVRNYSDYTVSEDTLLQGKRIRKELHLEGRFVASYIGGGLQPYRGVDVLIESMKIVLKTEPKAKLLIVGGHGVGLAALRERMRQLGVVNSCAVTGWVSSSQLAYYYMASDVGVVPHRRTAATEVAVPNKFFDYLVLGKPVIVTALKEISELIEDGVSGLIVKPDDPKDLAAAIIRLADDHGLVKRMNQSALKLGQKYMFAKVEDQFLEFITQLMRMRKSLPIANNTT